MDLLSLDYEFSKDLLHYILSGYYSSILWEPTGPFAIKSNTSPFSANVKLKVKTSLDTFGGQIHRSFDVDFPSKDISSKHYKDILCSQRIKFLKKPFSYETLLFQLILWGEYTALSYLYELKTSPSFTLHFIYGVISDLRIADSINDNFWSEFEEYCKIYTYADRIAMKLEEDALVSVT
ncbi:hypothetical protein NPIL_592841 [Nephila pilipes]|uniref:Uncharacterized protein n=1 Tax=Nephila pilipes TaxID=299642 RepID=A0A8X6PPY0_NEPPI|nr:hypothetical protein NPIL_592841 [Nephila pilipes]